MEAKIEKLINESMNDHNETDLFIGHYKKLEECRGENDIIKYFSKLKNNKTIFGMVFSSADVEGNLSAHFDSDFIAYMPNEEMMGEVYDAKYKHHYLEKELPVMVYDIDLEKKRILVSRQRARNKAQTAKRKELIQKLKNRKDNELIIEKGVIKHVDQKRKRVIIDIGNVGIMGYIPIAHWKQGYEYHLNKVANRNHIIDVDIMEYKSRNNRSSSNIYSKNEHFICSRKNLLPNPWIGIEERLPKDTVITFKCIHKVERNFFARIDGLDDIDVYVEYPKPGLQIPIFEGMKYQGFIYRVNEKTKLLKARVFKMLPDKVE
ncbi:hypothetical protein [Vallitalea guaymasensis]|uniref:hypothetical protein n=1 Tax=Vallitalea guaymasensis TaxID=1185412 RepID=UPI000DE53D57|nr:hypothetical protein [Vallitalea guaymasensis]